MEIEPHPVPLYSVLWGDRPVDGRTETERGRNTERERERDEADRTSNEDALTDAGGNTLCSLVQSLFPLRALDLIHPEANIDMRFQYVP